MDRNGGVYNERLRQEILIIYPSKNLRQCKEKTQLLYSMQKSVVLGLTIVFVASSTLLARGATTATAGAATWTKRKDPKTSALVCCTVVSVAMRRPLEKGELLEEAMIPLALSQMMDKERRGNGTTFCT